MRAIFSQVLSAEIAPGLFAPPNGGTLAPR